MIDNYTQSLEVVHNVSMNSEMDSELVKLAVMDNAFFKLPQHKIENESDYSTVKQIRSIFFHGSYYQKFAYFYPLLLHKFPEEC